MSRYSTRKPAVTKEQQVAKKVARALTEDFNSDLEGVGYSISADHAPIIFHRLETMYLASKDEHDRIMGREVETEGYTNKW
jgi:hypothetical protein